MTDGDDGGTSLAGHRALVTGASRGLGAALAARLAATGVRVAISARSPDALDQVASRIRSDSQVVVIPADLAVPVEGERLVAEASRLLGGLDIVINNASTVEPLGRFADTEGAEWERSLNVNFLAPARICRAALGLMHGLGWGRLLAISSGAAISPGIERGSAYSVAKTAVEALTCELAREVAGTHVTVNAIRPGTMNTAMQERMRRSGPHELAEATRERYARLYREGRLAPPDQVAGIILELLRSDLTGRILDVRRADHLADISAAASW